MTSTATTDPARNSVLGVSRVLLALYVVTLAWLTLFKLSYDIATIVAEHQNRSLNLIPFAGLGQTGTSETVSNFVTFIPLGVLLRMNMKRAAWWRLAVAVLGFSLAIESLQYILAIGITDATDVVMNTLGGLTGLLFYRLADKGMPTQTVDRIIAMTGVALFVAFLLLRLLVFKVRY